MLTSCFRRHRSLPLEHLLPVSSGVILLNKVIIEKLISTERVPTYLYFNCANQSLNNYKNKPMGGIQNLSISPTKLTTFIIYMNFVLEPTNINQISCISIIIFFASTFIVFAHALTAITSFNYMFYTSNHEVSKIIFFVCTHLVFASMYTALASFFKHFKGTFTLETKPYILERNNS